MGYLDIYDEMKVLDHFPHGLNLEKSGFQIQNQLFVQNPRNSCQEKLVTQSNTRQEKQVTQSNMCQEKMVTCPIRAGENGYSLQFGSLRA